MSATIDRNSYEPAYAQLSRILREQIAAGLFRPGDRLPSESQLCERYGVSPMTVRRVINMLSDQGMVIAEQGRGTFVKPLELATATFDLGRLQRLFRDQEQTTVRLLERRGNILRVEGLDAVCGTPVVDIKPYIPGNDSVADARVPSWVTQSRGIGQRLEEVYRRLMDGYGPQHWWPAEGPFEVMVGAILTQSAAWGNVEKAIASLKEAGALSPTALRRLPLAKLAKLIRPCGYYNAKALKLEALAQWLGESCADDLERLFRGDTATLRGQLLSIHGIGDETADSILLYAADKPVFVIDAYTRRILSRLGLAPVGVSYTVCQAIFMDSLPADSGLFNEYHALLVYLAKNVCCRRPRCRECCLADICPSRVTE